MIPTGAQPGLEGAGVLTISSYNIGPFPTSGTTATGGTTINGGLLSLNDFSPTGLGVNLISPPILTGKQPTTPIVVDYTTPTPTYPVLVISGPITTPGYDSPIDNAALVSLIKTLSQSVESSTNPSLTGTALITVLTNYSQSTALLTGTTPILVTGTQSSTAPSSSSAATARSPSAEPKSSA